MSKDRKRRHHYVPRFYLRYFSKRDSPGQIALWNLEKQVYIPKAGIAKEAYEIDLYGTDQQIEDGFAIIESNVAPIINGIIETRRLPSANSKERILLLLFIMFQAERTKAAAEELETTSDDLFHAVYKHDSRLRDYLPHVKLRLQNAAPFRLSMLEKTIPLIFDLVAKLLINDSEHDFVISDSPVVKYNQFHEARKLPWSGAGWASPGLQIILPLSPKVALILFDSDIYRVGNDSPECVHFNMLSDIDRLNGMQYVFAGKNVYLPPTATEYYAIRMHRRWARYRRSSSTVKEYPQINPDPLSSRKSSLIVTSLRDIRLGLELSFIKYRKPPEKIELATGMFTPRNEYVAEVLKEFYQEHYDKNGKRDRL